MASGLVTLVMAASLAAAPPRPLVSASPGPVPPGGVWALRAEPELYPAYAVGSWARP